MRIYGVHVKWIILVYALGILFGWGILKAETKKKESKVGCEIQAHYIKGKKRWTVWGYYKAPNVKSHRELLGTRYKKLSKAAQDCEKWMDRKMKIMPIPLTRGLKKQEYKQAYRRE